MERLQRVMLINGFMVILFAMLAGFMLMFSLLGGLELWPEYIVAIPVYGTSEGWVRAHSGGAMNGLLVVAVGLSLPKMALSTESITLTPAPPLKAMVLPIPASWLPTLLC